MPKPMPIPARILIAPAVAALLLAGTAQAQPEPARPEAATLISPASVLAPTGPLDKSWRQRVEQDPSSGLPMLTMDFAQAGAAEANGGKAPPRGPLGRMFDAVGYAISYVFSALTSGLNPPSPASIAQGTQSKDPYDFWKLIGDAGYKLREISTDVGVVPDVGFRFRYVRELSNADVTWLERRLERHARKFQDPLSFTQRSIIYALLEINSSDTYFVEELKIKLLPLPHATFSLSPWERGLSMEHDVLLRAIQGKKFNNRKPAEEDSHY
jgi:hypothetical protein